MLTLHVTSDSTPAELRAAAEFLTRLAGGNLASLISNSGDAESAAQMPLPLPISPAAATPAPAAVPISPAAATPAPAAVPPDIGVLDTDGLPWDARIHSSGRDKNGDGRWRKRRQVEDNVVAAVVAELRALVANMNAGRIDVPTHVGERAEDVIVPPPPPPLPTLDPAAVFGAPTPAAPAPTPAAPAPTPAAPAPTNMMNGPTPTTFVEIMPKIVALLSEKRLSHDDLTRVLGEHGVASLATLQPATALNPNLVSALWATICAQPGVLA